MFAFIGVLIGLAIGIAAGVWGGTFLFPNYFKELEYSKFDISADYDDSIPLTKSDGKPVPRTYRAYLKYISNWATMPDFFRATWMNIILKNMWPQYNQAIGKMVLETVKPQLEDLPKQYPFIEAVDIELIDFGTKPLRVGGIKVYDTTDDEVIMETAVVWGSNARVRASARIKIAEWAFYIPIEVSDFQMKVTSRMTLRPLVDTLPCMGAVTVTLIEAPYIDFGLHLFSRFDLMLLPGVRDIANYFLQGVLGDMLQYPNKMTFDIMEGGGVPPPPIGLLQVKVIKVENITAGGDLLSKVDPYVELGVRDDRYQRTRTLWNTKHPQFNEVFNLIVDDIDSQTLTLKLHDDDLGFNDPVIGIIEEDLADLDFMRQPRKRAQLKMDFISPPAHNKMRRLVKKQSEARDPQKLNKLPTAGTDEEGRKQYKIPDAPPPEHAAKAQHDKKAKVATFYGEAVYIPFKGAGIEQPGGPDAQRDGAESKPRTPRDGQQSRMALNTKVTDKDKGILTVTLTGCSNLESSDKDVDPYVEFTLHDPKNVKPEIQRSSHMHNEPNPHWNTKFDFAMISGTSVLAIHVYDKKTTFQNILHHPGKALVNKVTGKAPEAMDECIGTLRLKVKDVVHNERIRDSWALQETQKGDIHLTLDWNPIELDGKVELEEPGDQNQVAEKRDQQNEERKKEEQGGEQQQPEKSKKSHVHLPHIPFTHRKEKIEYEKH